jgi:hypothetical protein
VDPTPRFHTTLRHVGDRVVVVKIAHGADVALLRHEADILAELGHPGVVRVVATGGDESRFGLATAHVGIHALHTIPTPSVRSAAHIACQVITNLAHLHAAGVCHGRMEASHVIVGSTGEAVLCGLRAGCGLNPLRAANDVAQSAEVCTRLITQALSRLPRRNRRHHMALADTCLILLADHGPDAAPLAQRLTWTVTHRGPSRDVLVESERHFIGQQPSGNGQNQAITTLHDQSIEHASEVLRPQRAGRHAGH